MGKTLESIDVNGCSILSDNVKAEIKTDGSIILKIEAEKILPYKSFDYVKLDYKEEDEELIEKLYIKAYKDNLKILKNVVNEIENAIKDIKKNMDKTIGKL